MTKKQFVKKAALHYSAWAKQYKNKKSNNLIQKIKLFKKQHGSCYCLIDGQYYNAAFVINNIVSNDSIIKHNGCDDWNDLKVYTVLTINEYIKKIDLLTPYELIFKSTFLHTKNISFRPLNEFIKTHELEEWI